jgi:hypothetical protein
MNTTLYKRREGDVKTVAKSMKLVASIVASAGIISGAAVVVDQRYAKADEVNKMRGEIMIALAQTNQLIITIDRKLDDLRLTTQAITSERSVRRVEIDRRLDRVEKSFEKSRR